MGNKTIATTTTHKRHNHHDTFRPHLQNPHLHWKGKPCTHSSTCAGERSEPKSLSIGEGAAIAAGEAKTQKDTTIMTPEIKQRIQQIRQGKIPKGYKKTKEGIIPEVWNVKPVESCIEEYKRLSNDIRMYTVYSSSRNGLIPQSDYYDQKEAVETNKGYNLVPKGYITYRHMSDDDIFHFNINTTGTSILVSNEYPVFTTNCKSNTYFLVSALNESKRFLAFCKMQKKGGTRTRLYLSNLKQYQLPLPPLPEQTAIAEILSTQDRVIELKEQLLAEKKRQKKYLMQQLLTGKMRLKGFKGEWMEYKLENCVEFLDERRIPIKENERISGEYPYYGASGIIDYVDNYIFDGNFILLGEDGANIIDRSSPLAFKVSGKCWINNHAHVLLPHDDFNIDYLTNYLESLSYSKYNTGSAQPKLNQEICRKIIITVPPLPEQTAIAEILSTADREIELIGQSIEAEKRKKKSLMQLLLTGIVRVGGMTERLPGAS